MPDIIVGNLCFLQGYVDLIMHIVFLGINASSTFDIPIFGIKANLKFQKFLETLLSNYSQELEAMGFPPGTFGTHSMRKGSVTLVSSITFGPNEASIDDRAGWNKGNVKRRYDEGSQGGDQFIGRCLTGVSIHDTESAALPPHFPPDFVFDQSIWAELIPNANNYPATFKAIFPYLLASLVYHKKFLTETLAPSHPLLMTPLFVNSAYFTKFQSIIETGYLVNKKSKLAATGLAPTLPLKFAIESLAEQVETNTKALELNNKYLNKLEETIPESCAKTTVELLRNEIVIEGVQPLSRAELDDRMEQFERRIVTSISKKIEESKLINNAMPPEKIDEQKCNSQEKERVRVTNNLFYWANNGKFFPFPEDFEFPR